MNNSADLYQPIVSSRVGPPPVVIRTVVTPRNDGLVEGVPQTTRRGEAYILLSALPEELRRRVELAAQAIIAAG